MDEVFIMIACTVLVCASAVLLCVWFRRKRNIKVKIPIFCGYRICGKFIDSEVSIDDIGLAFQELELIFKFRRNNLL